jgi:5-oxoprolinase (ATP-hydrolysing) subunit B
VPLRLTRQRCRVEDLENARSLSSRVISGTSTAIDRLCAGLRRRSSTMASRRYNADRKVHMNDVRTYWLSETTGVLDIEGSVSIDAQRRIWWLAERFRSYPFLRDVVPGMNSLTVEVDSASPLLEGLLDALTSGWDESRVVPGAARVVEIPVHYGAEAGPDLDEVARHAGLSPEEVIRLHSAGVYTVYFLGFLPGFAYLGGLDKRLATPRRREPRVAVPAGSVGIGGEQTGVYPSSSPGGWHLIGRTWLKLFDPLRNPPSLLLPGDTVHFANAREHP